MKKFCDYIMLVNSGGKLVVILIELKRSSKDSEYKDQIAASRLFMDYVIANADRIKDRNGYGDFDPNSIRFRKVRIIKDKSFSKLTTKPRNKALEDGLENYITLMLGMQFNPAWVV